MDGNRRFAQKNNFDRAKGHLMGFDKLTEVRAFTVLALTEFLLSYCKRLVNLNQLFEYCIALRLNLYIASNSAYHSKNQTEVFFSAFQLQEKGKTYNDRETKKEEDTE